MSRILARVVSPTDQQLSAIGAFAMSDLQNPVPVVPFTKQAERKPFRVKISAFCEDHKDVYAVKKAFVLRPVPGTDDYEPEPQSCWFRLIRAMRIFRE